MQTGGNLPVFVMAKCWRDIAETSNYICRLQKCVNQLKESFPLFPVLSVCCCSTGVPTAIQRLDWESDLAVKYSSKEFLRWISSLSHCSGHERMGTAGCRQRYS